MSAMLKIQCNTCHKTASLAFKLYKFKFRPRFWPGPLWGSIWCSPRSPSRLGRGYPLPIEAFGISLGISLSMPLSPTSSWPWL